MKETLTIQGIVDLASAYYGSAVLFAALNADVFTAIKRLGDEATADAVAERGKIDPRATRLLLDACVALGLLFKDAATGVYTNTSATGQTLVTGGHHDLTRAIRYNCDVYPAWGKLQEFVKTGRPVESPAEHLGDDAERTRRFALAMFGRAMGIGRTVVPMLDLEGCATILDLAGGPAAYAMLMTRAYDGITRCVTVDLPAISAVAQELVEQERLTARVECRAGDYHTDVYEAEAYDAVTIFGALHQESPETTQDILRRAYAALKPGGKIFILDMMTDATHTDPPFSALFAVNMALTTDNGWVFSDAELRTWLERAGFVACETQRVPPPMPHWLVTAHKAKE